MHSVNALQLTHSNESYRKPAYILLGSRTFVQPKQCFENEDYFIQRAFTNFQGPLWKIEGLFKDFSFFVNFQGLFEGYDAFSRTFQGPWEP